MAFKEFVTLITPPWRNMTFFKLFLLNGRVFFSTIEDAIKLDFMVYGTGWVNLVIQ